MLTLKEIRSFSGTERLYNPSKYNEQIRAAWMPIWVRNAGRNWNYIYEKYKDENRDVSVLKEERKPVIIVGSGPSLNDFDELWHDWEGAVMCSSSHLQYFAGIGRLPDYCVIIDADPAMSFLVGDADTSKTTLLTHPNMDPPILEKWQGPIYFFRMLDPGDDWFSKYIPMMYSVMNPYTGHGIKSYVMNSGNVVNTMIAISQYIGYGSIFLAGYDLGYPDDVYRFTNFKKVGKKWEREAPPELTERMWSMMGHNGVKTDTVNCFYKYSTFVLWGLDNAEIYSCSRGIVDELPYIKPKEVIKRKGKVPKKLKLSADEKYKICQTYLASRGMYLIRRKTKHLLTLKCSKKRYKRLKKFICKVMCLGTYLKKMEKVQRVVSIKNIRKSVLRSPKLNVRLIFDIYIQPGHIDINYPPRVGVTNKYGAKGLDKLRMIIEFHLGRFLKIW